MKSRLRRYFIIFLSLLYFFVFVGCEAYISEGNNAKNNTGTVQQVESDDVEVVKEESASELLFRNDTLLEEHFKKHGEEFPYETKEAYLAGANKMLNNPKKLHKKEKEDNDDVYYLEDTNEFIIVSTDGYIRTYFKPSNGIKYYNKQ